MEEAITGAGSISANWVLVVTVIVLGYFMNRTLNKIEKILENHETKLNDHETRIQLSQQFADTYVSTHQITFNEIMNKLNAIQKIREL